MAGKRYAVVNEETGLIDSVFMFRKGGLGEMPAGVIEVKENKQVCGKRYENGKYYEPKREPETGKLIKEPGGKIAKGNLFLDETIKAGVKL
jgi:hypothetical protein